jgi:outer membrane biosynthesis protein TonB
MVFVTDSRERETQHVDACRVAERKNMHSTKIRKWVISAHMGVLVFALVATWLSERDRNRDEFEKFDVSLVNEVVAGEEVPPESAQETEEPPGQTVEPSPPEASPAQTVTEPAIKEKTAPAPKAKPERKTWKPRSPADIRKSMREHVEQVRPNKTRKTPAVSLDDKQLASELKRELNNQFVSMRTSYESASRHQQRDIGSEYASRVSAIMHRKWHQPNVAVISADRLKATVELVVRRDGSVQKAALIKGSGNVAMDASLRDLIKHLESLPAFDEYAPKEVKKAEFQIVFELR